VRLVEVARTVALVILILGFAVRRLEAQRAEPIGVGPAFARETRSPPAGATLPAASERDTASSRRSIVARDALIGAGVGAVTGLITAVIVTRTGNYSNHSEDGLAYLYFPIYGAMAGLVAGVIVGLIQIL
jgi:hypothetical protein